MSGGGGRISWPELPAPVRAGVEQILGEPVVSAASQPGGFSPGSADRVRLASGRGAFVKAASAQTNAVAATLHRREAAVTATLPHFLPVPGLLGVYDDGTWVALVLTDVAGRHPDAPWTLRDTMVVLDALADVAAAPLPPGLVLPRSEDSLHGAYRGWEKLRSRPLEGLDPWAAENMDVLVEMARHGTASLAGESLVHGDLRSDNILLTDGGRAVLVDWPYAARGAAWLDALSVLIDVNTDPVEVHAGHVLARHPIFADAGPDAVTGVLAGWAGYYLDMSRRPAPPGIPALRGFQRKQADALLRWLKTRL
ncbi:phosphotransferase [Specibacter sp. RAF43]|uniref:phosphotransferase n=1 Tax=Specibacter sp. RAF43 TaxID=3233057 RepID=UPI003F9DDF5A